MAGKDRLKDRVARVGSDLIPAATNRIESWIIGSCAHANVKQRKRDGGFKTLKTFTTDTSRKRLDEAVAEVENAAEDFVGTL